MQPSYSGTQDSSLGMEWQGVPRGLAGKGLGARAHPTASARSSRETEAAPAGLWNHNVGPGCGAQLSRAHGQARQGCGGLETSSATASLEQGRVAPGGWHGVLGRDTQGGGQGLSGPLLLSGPCLFHCTNLPFLKGCWSFFFLETFFLLVTFWMLSSRNKN